MTEVLSSIRLLNNDGITIGSTTLSAPNVPKGLSTQITLNLPNKSDTLIGLTTSDTLENKTIIGGSKGNVVNANMISGLTLNSNEIEPGSVLIALDSHNATWKKPSINNVSSELKSVSTLISLSPGEGMLEYVDISNPGTHFVTTRIVGVSKDSKCTGAGYQLQGVFFNNGKEIKQISSTVTHSYPGQGFGAVGTTFEIHDLGIRVKVISESSGIMWKSSTNVLSV